MANDLVFSCMECITFYYLLLLVGLFTLFLGEVEEGGGGGGGGGILCNSCYICVVYLLTWKKILDKKNIYKK